MLLRALLVEAENALYPYTPCHSAGMTAAHALADLSMADFQAAYTRARDQVKKRLGARVRDRLLYFQIMVEQGGVCDPDRVLAYHEAYWQAYFDAMQPDPDAVTVLRQLAETGVKLALVSNLPLDLALREASVVRQKLGVAAAAVSVPVEVGSPLPASDVIYHALNKLGLTEEEVWVVGLASQPLLMAAQTEDLFIVQLDARQTGKLPPGSFGVRGWAGFARVIASMQERG